MKNLQKSASNNSPDSELCEIMTKILEIPRKEVIKHINLFQKINHYTLNCLYYLSLMKSDQDKITAVHSLEFVYNFDQGVDKYLLGKVPKLSLQGKNWELSLNTLSNSERS